MKVELKAEKEVFWVVPLLSAVAPDASIKRRLGRGGRGCRQIKIEGAPVK